MGLVDRVVAPESVYDEALAWARQLGRGPRLAMQAAKVAIARGMETDLEDGLEIERVHFASLFGTQDREIGMRTFIEKGPGQAEFTGS
jgi:enoyl-CoA hydratase/carnithine racemase